MPIRTIHSGAAAGLVLAAVGLLALAGCSSAETSATSATTEATAQAQTMPEGAGGTTGEIAAIDGTTLQVQSADSQSAVTYDDATTITATVSGTLADVTAGLCVTVMGATEEGTTATSVGISAAEDGECGLGSGGFGGGAPGGDAPGGDASAGAVPEGAPSSMPEDGEAPTGGGFGGITSGLVIAVDASTITVETTDAEGTASTTTVTVDDVTSYTTTADADASAIAVGLCVTAQGESDDSGSVAATSLELSEAGEAGCTSGFGAMGAMMPGSGEEATDD